MAEWTPYAERKPESVGPHLWRMKHRRMPVVVEFTACTRLRGAGHMGNVVSPSFDYWDGYGVLVPSDVEWSATKEACKPNEYVGVSVLGHAPVLCPFCGKRPQLRGVERDGRAVIFPSDPSRWSSWWLECCEWSRTPHLDNPVTLIQKRNAVLAPIPAPPEEQTK